MFFPSSSAQSRVGLDEVISVENVYKTAATLGFACHYTSPSELPQEWTQPAPGGKQSVWLDWEAFQKFEISWYWGAKDDDTFLSATRPLGTWLSAILNGTPTPEPGRLWPICYGGNFVARRANIKAVDQLVWQRASHALMRADNLEEGHYMERSWAGLLTPRLSDYDESLLLSHASHPKHRGNPNTCAADDQDCIAINRGSVLLKCECDRPEGEEAPNGDPKGIERGPGKN